MKQYCRYCVFCFEADDFRCSNHPRKLQPHWNREQINRENHCKNFALFDLGDVETGKQYNPRQKTTRRKATKDGEQLKLEV